MKRYSLLAALLLVLAGNAPALAKDVCLDCHEIGASQIQVKA